MLVYDSLLMWHAPSPGNWMSVPRVTSVVTVAGKRCGTTGTVPPECLGHHQGIARAYFQSDCLKVSSFSFRTRQTSHLDHSVHGPQNLYVSSALTAVLQRIRKGADKSLAFPIFLLAAQPKDFFVDGLKKLEQRSVWSSGWGVEDM
jgi:hypothetical protein